MRIAIIGAGYMGSWLVESLCLDYEVGVFDTDRNKLRYFFNSRKFLYYEEILDFTPDLLINAVSDESAIIITESDEEGKAFFREFYSGLKVRIHEYTFREHDETIAYSLSIP